MPGSNHGSASSKADVLPLCHCSDPQRYYYFNKYLMTKDPYLFRKFYCNLYSSEENFKKHLISYEILGKNAKFVVCDLLFVRITKVSHILSHLFC